MLRIKQIHIKNFRSIINETINTDRFNIFVGLNDAGKSNVLKALNLFFNGETEPGKRFDFDVDYSNFAPERKNKAKEIEISILIEIPDHYKDNEDVLWKKVWRISGQYYDSSMTWTFSPYSKVPTLLKRIRFKYVPAVKSEMYFKDLLADLYISIANEVSGDLIEKASAYSEALKSYTKRIGEIVHENVGLKSELTMPANQMDIFKELVFMTQDGSGKDVDLSHRGDGIKAMHIPAILKYIAERDNRNLGSNAVPYTPIWGYEEPENGVEMRKSFDLAEELYGFSPMVQQFVTTHSPAFYEYNGKKSVKVIYVYKDDTSYASTFSEEVEIQELHNRIGLMPIVAPFIEDKQHELAKMQEIVKQMQFADIDTIFVEGKTDKEYLELAICELSHQLEDRIKQQTLRIVTREENGCGTSLLCDWAIAWMHLNYKNKAVFLFDNDTAGLCAKKEVNEAKKKYPKKSSKVKALTLCPTDDIKMVNQKINGSIHYEIEHLLPYKVWEQLKNRNWVNLKDDKELFEVYNKLLTRDKSIDTIIDDVVDNAAMRETIVYYNVKDDKKNNILEYVKKLYSNGKTTVLDGFENTIKILEKEF